MQKAQDQSFDALVEQYLRTRLPKQMVDSIHLSKLGPDAKAFITRMLRLMKRAGYSATDFNPNLARWLSSTLPSILPSAWDGRIPPITLPGRHRKNRRLCCQSTQAY